MNRAGRAGKIFGYGVLAVFAFLVIVAGERWLNVPLHLETRTSPVDSLPRLRSRPSVAENLSLRINAAPLNPPASLPDSPDRVADARVRCGGALAAKFAAAKLVYPPKELFLRVFKYEGELEIWARDQTENGVPFRLVSQYPILCAFGRLGPKRQEGDLQVPEGFYLIDRFNPRSLFHLSLGINYPNASDRILTTDRAHPGFDVFIHGNCVSAGCMAMGDPVIEEIFLAAWDAKLGGQQEIPVHIFPGRMDARNWAQILAPVVVDNESLRNFWRSLQAGFDDFEQKHQVPLVRVRDDGFYNVLNPAAGK